MVNLRNCIFEEFISRVQDKQLFCFGYGDQAKIFFNRHGNSNIATQITNIIDNNPDKPGCVVDIGGKLVKTLTFSEFINVVHNNSIILLTSVYCLEMLAQLDQEPCCNGVETYISIFMDSMCEVSDFEFTLGDMPKIPKKIHYCWFGGDPLPQALAGYMESWRRHCPDYEIICWDESNYDVTKNRYMFQAYKSKKWGFVPDYARLDIIYEHGGIYLDTDVEVLKSFDDLRNDEMFCGFEQSGGINFGNGFGAVKGHELIRRLRDVYDSVLFENEDGSFNVTPCVYYQEPVLEDFQIKLNGLYQNINGVIVYPSEVLDAENQWSKKVYLTPRTHCLHHYASSWWDNPKMNNAAEKLRQSYGALLKRMGMEEHLYVQ